MKEKPADKNVQDEDDLLPEYDFDYSKGRPNRFAASLPTGARIVTLDPNVAEVCPTPSPSTPSCEP